MPNLRDLLKHPPEPAKKSEYKMTLRLDPELQKRAMKVKPEWISLNKLISVALSELVSQMEAEAEKEAKAAKGKQS